MLVVMADMIGMVVDEVMIMINTQRRRHHNLADLGLLVGDKAREVLIRHDGCMECRTFWRAIATHELNCPGSGTARIPLLEKMRCDHVLGIEQHAHDLRVS